ncbi:MAG: ATP-binding protein [Bacteroidetes bacterium]|nr:ATP-binding protein [Bacteroidota bacterium]
MKKILVVGDWVVDDNWVVGSHQSETSTRIGTGQFRSLHDQNSTVQSFCGAGRIASLLYRSQINDGEFCSIVGLGIWHKRDEALLRNMFDPMNTKGITPFSLMRNGESGSVAEEKVILKNLAETEKLKMSNCATSRVFRFYKLTGSKVEQLERIDWECPPKSFDDYGHPVWFDEKCDEECEDCNDDNQRCLSELLLEIKSLNITHVVIKDLCKGVVSRVIIEHLAKHFSEIPWYISTKAWNPEWLNIIKKKNVNIRLLLVPQAAARTAIKKELISQWITKSGIPSQESLEEIRRLDDEVCGTNMPCLIVVLPDGLSLVARGIPRYYPNQGPKMNRESREGIIQSNPTAIQFDVSTGMASAFFAHLIVELTNVNEEELKKEKNLRRVLGSSLDFAADWSLAEERMLKNPADIETRKEPHIKEINGDYINKIGVTSFKWKEKVDEWNCANKDIGVIVRDGRQCIELSRAMNEIDGVVCCVKWKRDALKKIVKLAGDFKQNNPRRQMSCILLAKAGSGKTNLVRCLAKNLRYRIMQFDITQMLSKRDILDCFETIITVQGQDRDKDFLIFIDEINGEIANQSVYDTFLAPLEEGEYVRAGKRFKIDPGLWVFAGTGTQQKIRTSTKGSDFISRLSIPPINMVQDIKGNEEHQQSGLEAVYTGIKLIRNVYPDVRSVEKGVLRMFRTMKSDCSIRELKKFIQTFSGIQYGIVRVRNVPRSEISPFTDMETLRQKGSEEFVYVID